MAYTIDWTKSPALAYALKPGALAGAIRYPGTQADADALERLAEDQMEDALGLTANELANTFVITIG